MLLLDSFLNLLNPYTFAAMTFGVAWGILMGVMPGFGGTLAVVLLLPFTFSMDPNTALPMLAGVYAGAIYGGGITAILIGVPGTSAAAATIADGFAMTKKGQSKKALTTSVYASAFGGIFGGIILLLFAPMLAKVTLLFGPAELFMLSVFGLTIIASLIGGSIIKGLIAGVLGLMAGTVGIDPISGVTRFTFGQTYLFDGFSMIPMILGLFAFPITMEMVGRSRRTKMPTISNSSQTGSKIRLSEMASLWRTLLRSSFIGTFVGAIPGAGANIACWIGYGEARRASKHPEKFGTGLPEGVAAAEAANNAVEGGSMIPLMTLSIPGNATAAVMLSALMIHGLVPGPELFTTHADKAYTYIMAVIFSNFIMLAMGFYLAGLFARVANVPVVVLASSIFVVTMLGSYAARSYVFDLWVTVGIGCVAYVMTRFGFSVIPILLGVILGPIAEAGLRRALLLNGDDWTIFVTRPICLVLLVLSVLSIFVGMRLNKQTAPA
ncbi:MAG: tripartite tricarboxylate transporter permease [Marinosulfonomonas sp.]|nr:tripartite tricarboxylate transporter permease [Marinosulfonomonas sp.]